MPNNFAVLDQANRQQQYSYFRERIIAGTQYLSQIKVKVDQGDLRLKHTCMFYLPNSQSITKNQSVSIFGLSNGANYVECRVPINFELIGNLQLTLLVNDEQYSNFIEIQTYPFTDIISVSPNIIHGVHSKFQIQIALDKDYSVNLPERMTIQVDDGFYEGSKIPQSLNVRKISYQAMIAAKFYAKEHKTSPIKFSFNQHDYYQTEKSLTYLPDLQIMGMFPKKASLFQSVRAQIFAKNVHFDNSYWCLTSDGVLTEAILQKDMIPQVNMERIHIYCNIQAQYFPMKIFITILSNGGQSSAITGNFIEYKSDPPHIDPLTQDNFFQLVQVSNLQILTTQSNEVSVKTITYVTSQLSRLIDSVTCIYNNSAQYQGQFSFKYQQFKCPMVPSNQETFHQLRIVVNKLQELKNTIRVIVHPVLNLSVELSYNVLLSNWQYQEIQSIQALQKSSIIYLDHCSINLTIGNKSTIMDADFNHQVLECDTSRLAFSQVATSIIEINRLNKIQIYRNYTLIKLLQNPVKPQPEYVPIVDSINQIKLSPFNTTKVPDQSEVIDYSRSFLEIINNYLDSDNSVNIKGYKVIDNGKGFQLYISNLKNSDYSVKCDLEDNSFLEFADHSKTCFSNFDFMRLRHKMYSLSLNQQERLISNNITIPVIVPNKLYFINESPLYLSDNPITLRFTVDARQYSKIIKNLTTSNTWLVISINELQGIRIVPTISKITIVDDIELFQEVKQMAVDLQFTFEGQDLLFNEIKEISSLTFNLRIHCDLAIVAMQNIDRFFFDAYHLNNQRIYVQPHISNIMFIEKTNITVIELSRVLPANLLPQLSVHIKDKTRSLNLSINFTQFYVDDSRVYIQNLRNILENLQPGINQSPIRLTIIINHISGQYSKNRAILNLEGQLQPDRQKYVNRFNTSFISYPVSNLSLSQISTLAPIEPLHRIDYNSTFKEILAAETFRVNQLNFTTNKIYANTSIHHYENFTELLIKDDLETQNMTYTYNPSVINSRTYYETQSLKSINLSLINTTFVSLKDRQQVIVTLNRPKLNQVSRIKDEFVKISQPGEFNRNTQCVLYRFNQTLIPQTFNQSLWDELVAMQTLNFENSQQLLNQVIVDDSESNYTQVSLVFEGNLSLNSTRQKMPPDSIIMNETNWYRNLSRDTDASRLIQEKILSNSVQQILGNQSQYLIRPDLLYQIEQFINLHEYLDYLKQLDQFKAPDNTYFNQFKQYSQIYGRLKPLEGFSLSALYFESSPVPGVFGKFAKFLESQRINLSHNRTLATKFNQSSWQRNASLIFTQTYTNINFTQETVNKGSISCPTGSYLVRSNLSDTEYACQTYTPKLQVKDQINITYQKAFKNTPLIKQQPQIRSPFFNQSAQFTISQKLIVSGQREQIMLSSNENYMSYDDFAQLNLTCRFYNIERIDRVHHETACYFASPNLNVIVVEIKPYKLKQGTYRVQFVMKTDNQTIVSAIDESLQFEVLLNPQLFSVYPRNFIFSNSVENRLLYLIGRSFTYLNPVEGRLFCKLKFQLPNKLEQVAYLDASIISDFVVECSFKEKAFQNNAIKIFKTAPLVQFQLGLSVDRKEVTLNSKNVDPAILTIRSVQPINIQYTDPKSLSIAQTSQLDLQLFVTRSQILNEKTSQHAKIDFYCQFYQSTVLIAESIVLAIDSDYSPKLVKITCEMPLINTHYEQGEVRIGLVIKRTPLVTGIPQINFNLTQNLHNLMMMRVPTITNVYPPKIFNLALTNQLVVLGRDFENSHNLVCLLRSSVKVHALFETDGQLICKFKGLIDISIPEDMTIQISNDNGNTYSQQYVVKVITEIPQFRFLEQPTQLQSNTKYDLVIRGMNFKQMMSIGIKIQQGNYEQFSFCNISTTDADVVTCFNLFFPVKGTYNTFIVPDMNRQQQIRGLLKIRVDQFNQAQYTFPLPLPIPNEVQQPVVQENPPSIMSIDEKVISLQSIITIRGIAFKEHEEYVCSFLPDNQQQQQPQFTRAQYIDKETLQWTFKYIHHIQMMACGQIVIKDSKGSQYQAQGYRNIQDSLVCYINDIMIDDMSLASFPFNMDPTNYYNDLYINPKTLDLLRNNKDLRSKIDKIELDYDGLETMPCSLQYQQSLIRCGIAHNSKRHFKRVRLWLVINSRLKFDVNLMFNYYDYLQISSTEPSTNLVHLTNKDLLINSNYIVNSQTLSCIIFGDNIAKVVIQAIFISSTQLKCNLSPLVFENANVTVHITNDPNYFSQVNISSSGVPFLVKPRLPDTLNLATQNNQQQLNLVKIKQDMETKIQLEKQARHDLLVAKLEAIKFVKATTNKLLTGPWLNQFSLVVDDLTGELETLKCVMITKIKEGRDYQIYSDGVSINAALNQITCFYRKQILYQTNYCVELHISSPLGTYQTNKCYTQMTVYHVPTVTHYTEVQESFNQYLIDSEIIGHYLNNWSNQWLCFFYIFEENFNAPIKILYNQLPTYLLQADRRRIECRFSDALYFFSTFKKLQIKGMTNLKDFFYDGTVNYKNKAVENMFLYSHLVALVDPKTFSMSKVFQRGESSTQPSLMSQKIEVINQPGDNIGITGYFLDNTKLTVVAMLTALQDQTVKFFSKPCLIVSTVYMTCQIPTAFQVYGYYMISLYEQETMYKVNDENLLQIIVLPRPVIMNTQMDTYVTSVSDYHLSGSVNSQVYVTHFKVKFHPVFNQDFLSQYKQKYLDQTLCRIGSRHLWVQSNLTWISPNQIQCTIKNFYNFKAECVEVSINRGKDYTQDCQSNLQPIRAPIGYQFQPRQTMLKQPLTITIDGKDFVDGEIYKCLFHPNMSSSEYLSPGFLNNLVTAVYINTRQLTCTVPLSVQNASNSVYVSLYYKGIKVTTFKDIIYYVEYLKLLDVYPVRGTHLGGTPLLIRVENLADFDVTYFPQCRFSLNFMQTEKYFVVDAVRFNQTHITCMTPSIADSFNDYLETQRDAYVTVNDLDGEFRQINSLLFTYVKDYGLLEVFPTSTYMRQQQSITLKGKGLLNLYTLVVKLVLDSTSNTIYFRQNIFYINEETIVVQMPIVQDQDFKLDRKATFYVSLNDGVDWSQETVDFVFYEEPQMTRLSKYQVNLKGRVPIVVLGLYFRPDITGCLFDADLVQKEPESNSTAIICMTQPQPQEKKVRVRLLIEDNYEIQFPYLYFNFEKDIQINSIQPNEGFKQGGNQVFVFGNFSYFFTKDIKVRFGDNYVTNFNNRIAPYFINFTVPAVTAPKTVQFYIEFEDITYTNETIVYYYKSYSSFTSISPITGPSNGGTLVTVIGSDFDDQTFCYIGKIKVKPILISTTQCICETPKHKQGLASFELTFNNLNYITQNGLTFTYYYDSQINLIEPTHISLFAGRNQVLIDLYGWGFINTADLKVRISGDIISATFLDKTHLQFIATNQIQEGSHTVWVSNNGIDFQRGHSKILLNYYKKPGITEISPQMIQIGPPQITLSVYGSNFPLLVPIFCVFIIPGQIQVNSEANVISDMHLECLAPTFFKVLNGNTDVQLRITYNYQELYGLITIPYYPTLVLKDFTEKYFIQSMSQIVVQLTGENFMNKANELTCVLQDWQNVRQKAFNIYFVDSTQILCSFHMPDTGYHSLLVSNNDLQFINATARLRVIDSIQVVGIQPKIILSTNYNQMIIVQATHLFQGCQCLFEIKTSDNERVNNTRDFTVGKILNNNLMLCYVPNYSDLGNAVINVRVSYQTYLKAQSNSSVLLTIVNQCPPGFSCLDHRIQECPRAHYCPGGALNQSAHTCPIGYYQDKVMSTTCKPCPKGFMCPFRGMNQPIACPPGHICDKEKLNSPNIQCLRGSYCFPGTQTDDINDFGLFFSMPHKCQIGSYCKSGMKTGVVIFNSNTSTPAPCKRGMICEEGSYDSGGFGPCPAGFYCPRPNITGIPCPPRHYCPERGNTFPIKCPRGSFNFQFGQRNCTLCTLGRICPVEGLSMPLYCPPGFVCNKEGLIYPETLCRVGHICLGGVMTGTDNKKRSCYISSTLSSCPTGRFYENTVIDNVSKYFPNYFYGENVCCMNGTEIHNYIVALGRANLQLDMFQSYAYIINTTGSIINKQYVFLWDGMRIMEKAYNRTVKIGFIKEDQLQIPVRKHRELILKYFYNMYTQYMQELCPGKSLCLEGVNTMIEGTGLISQPFGCPTGSFCQKGSDSVIGSGLCPIGYYCPPNTEKPIEAPPGRYTGAPGAVEAQICQPGTYADQFRSTECKQCPNGFECKVKETRLPTICPVGNFRSVIQSNVCLACPRGTFSFERGARDLLECLECPPGRICDTESLYNISQTIACTDGSVCATGTGMRQATPCPQGYYCEPQTRPDTVFKNICDRGFFCRIGTGFSTKNRDTCPQTYYCPPGTGFVVIQGTTSDYSMFAIDTIYTRCPYGTGDDGSDTKNKIEQCTINPLFKMLEGDLSIRPSESSTDTQTNTRPQTNPASGGSGSARILTGDPFFSSSTLTNNQKKQRQRRGLISQQELKEAEEMLKELYEIEFALAEVKDRIRDNPSPINLNVSPIQGSINNEREYIARWCPLNMSLISEYIEMEQLTDDALESNVPNVIFDLPASSVALVTVDLRHLRKEDYRWTYGEDYQISFTVHNKISIDDPSDPVPMPEQFLNPNTSKNDVLEFQILATANVQLRVDILLYNSLFLNYRLLFVNTTSVEIRTPNRASYGEYGVFILSIVFDYEITLPHNIPKLTYDGKSLPNHLASLAYSRNDWDPLMHKSTKNRNIWVPSSLYWGERPRINFNFIPFFSNCKGYGKFIPFWTLMEQHQACNLVPFNETVWMNEYSFGLKPTADNCNEALIQCIYDEKINDRQPNDRWFEVLTGTPIFQVTVEPFLFEDVNEMDYDPTEILEVMPMFDGDFTDMVPRAVAFSISYYQVDNSKKRIILAELAFDNFKVLSPEEDEGTEKVFYNLTFNFLPLSHKDLTINFAFTSRFYIILYLLVGSIATIITVIFVMYHRIVGRPPRGDRFNSFKFGSYLKLLYSPAAYGVVLGLGPIIIGNGIITVLIAGHLMSIDTHLFSCSETGGDSACIYTLFDLIMDNPNNVNIDYVVLRTGRTGSAFLVMGAYVTIVSLLILVPDKNEAGKVSEAYDGNIWEYFIWKRSNIMFTAVFLMFFELATIQFSFSDIYGNNAWVMMGVFKVVEIVVEGELEKSVSEALMLSPLQVSFAVVLGLTGFGAANFLDFLQGYFIDVGITMFERPYFDSVFEVVQGAYEDYFPKISRAFAKWVTIKDDEEVIKKDEDEDDENNDLEAADEEEKKGDDEEEEGKEEEEEDSEEESSGSEIKYSDDSSIESNMDDLSLDDDPNVMLFNMLNANDSDIPSVDVSMEMREKKRKEIELKEKRQRDLERHLKGKAGEEEAKDHEKEFAEYQKGKTAENKDEEVKVNDEEDVKMDDVELEEVEPLIDAYGGYCNDTLSLIYQPFFTGLIWVYYDETVVASLYGIRIQDFIFYFLFNLVIIPFQSTIDIMFYNLQEWFHGFPAHDYADYMAFKFKKRKLLWKSNEDQRNNQIESSVRSLDQMCFSSQYYFIITLCASGFNQIVLGIQILLGVKDYNIFGDMATIPLVLFMSALCVIVHRLCIAFGKAMNIWQVQMPLDKVEVKIDNTNIGELFRKVLEPKKYNAGMLKNTPDEVKFDSYKWLNADRIKVEEDANMKDLKTDRMVAETFRDLFMKHNKPWVQEQIYEIFTPRTLFLHREEILNQFKKIMGNMQPDISTDGENSIVGLQDDSDFEDEFLKAKQKKNSEKKEELQWVQNNDTPMTRAIIKFWIIRARFRQKAQVQVSHLIDYMRKPFCLYCRTIYGLKVELMQNIEDLFFQFLKKKKADLVSYRIVDWQRYFAKYCSTRTICQDCHREIELHHQELKKALRKVERRRLGLGDEEENQDSDDDDEILDDEVTLANRKVIVTKKPPYVRKIIRYWIAKAQDNLQKQGKGRIQYEEYYDEEYDEESQENSQSGSSQNSQSKSYSQSQKSSTYTQEFQSEDN